MNKFISLSVLMLGLLVAGSVATAQEYNASQDSYNPGAKSAFNCVKGVVDNAINTHPDFDKCALATKQPLSNFDRSLINRYLTTLNEAQLEKLTTDVLGKTITVNLHNKERILLSVLDQVGYSSQPCSFEHDKDHSACGQSRRYHENENDHRDHHHHDNHEGRWF